ncbi:hypothetical protein [Streptomyces sp. NPDC001135]
MPLPVGARVLRVPRGRGPGPADRAPVRGAERCTGTFAGTHLRLVDRNGKFAGGEVVNARITGDIAVLKDSTLTWAYAPVTPAYATALDGASATTTRLRIARLKP